MKHLGSNCDYIPERNLALVAIFKELLRSSEILDMGEIVRRVTRSAAPRYYISEERLCTIMNTKRRTGRFPGRNPMRLRLYRDLEREIESVFKEGEATTLIDACYVAANRKAPSFYLTESSVKSIIYNTLRAIRNGEITL